MLQVNLPVIGTLGVNIKAMGESNFMITLTIIKNAPVRHTN